MSALGERARRLGPRVKGPGVNPSLSIYRSPYPLFANVSAATVDGTAYFLYLGYFAEPKTINWVEFPISANGSGNSVCEVGLFSTPDAPDTSAKTFTKLTSTATTDSTVAGSLPRLCRNTNALGYTVPAGTHLWAGFRTANSSAEPSVRWVLGDHSAGSVQSLASSGALTDAGPFGPATVPAVTGNAGPDMWARD